MYLKETLTLPEELRVLNSLQDMKITHNAVIMVEQKTAEELAADAGASEAPGAQRNANADIENIDDSENLRTVIASVAGFEDFQRY